MRVTNELLASNVLFDLTNTLFALSLSQRDLSSGKRVRVPSDDPLAFNQIINLQVLSNQQTTFVNNGADAKTFVEHTETALSSMSNILQRARVLYARGATDVLSPQDRTNIVAELNSLIKDAAGIANTAMDGVYLFAGSRTQTQPFTLTGDPPTGVTYAGDNLFIPVQIDNSESVNQNIPGNQAFLGGAQPFNNVFTTLINLRDAFQNTQRLSLMPINDPPLTVDPALTISAQSGNFATPPAAGAGSFTINNVPIAYDPAVDSLNAIVTRINTNANLTGLVTASLDLASPTDARRIILASSNGHLVQVQDVTGNFTQFMQLQDNLQQIDAAQRMVLNHLGTVGSTVNRITQVRQDLQTQQFSLTARISRLGDTDVPRRIADLNNQQASLQAALQVGSRVITTSLFDFLR